MATLLVAAVLTACGGGDGTNAQPYSPAPPSSTQPGGLSGRVLSANDGQPVAGATVEVGDITTTTTGADGSFSVSGLTETDRLNVRISAVGYASTVRITSVTGAAITTVPTQLLPVATTGTINAAIGGTVSVAGTTAQVTFTAGSIVDANGAAPTQPVLVQLTPINPALDPNLMPGDYRTTNNSAPAWIESFGALTVVLTDAAGGRYNLGAGQTATLRIPAASRATTLPASVPLFWFNETTGQWVREGTATLAGTAPNQYYEGTVSHFTTWNADNMVDSVLVSGCVQDMSGAPVPRARIELDGVTYSGTTNVLTDRNGSFSVPMRRDATAVVSSRWGAQVSNARAVTTTSANTSLGSQCLIFTDAAVSIRLTWGARPLDVDSHLLTPDGAHVSYVDQGSLVVAPYANLDIDDVTSFGPEIVTIRRLARGTYRYFLHNYSGTFDPGMTGSPVKVEITHNGNTNVFRPTTGEGTSRYWHAFDIVVDSQCNVTVTPANTWAVAQPANPNPSSGGSATYCN